MSRDPRPFLTARWARLLMANWEVDTGVLRSLVPRGTELDLFEGRCLMSVVGFRFLDTRVLGVGLPFHRDFEEVNLRFYVKREVGTELRRGVVFVKEIVPKRAIAWIANVLYHEPYVALPMRHEDRIESSGRLAYEWRQEGRWSRIGATVEGDPFLPEESSEETFITEHYWGYTARRDGATAEYRVEHPRWPIRRANDAALDGDVATLYGAEFAPWLSAPPTSCFMADGSEITVGWGRRLPPDPRSQAGDGSSTPPA